MLGIAAATLALVTVTAALGYHGHAPTAQDGEPSIEVLHAGAAVDPPLVELHASPEPAGLELVAHGVGAGAEVSVRAVRHTHWGDGAPPPAAPVVADHGGGEATVTLDRTVPGELVVEAAATGGTGEARALYVVRVLDALPPPGSPDRAAPSRVVGRVDPGDPALPRIRAQASMPLCADTPHVRDDVGSLVPWRLNESWKTSPSMSGVPPIEGVAIQDAEILDSAGEGISEYPWWWGCHTRASFGTQVPQWIYVCDVPGSDRTRYYTRIGGSGGGHASASYAINPHTGELNEFSHSPPGPQAAAPGPYWIRSSKHDYASDHTPPLPDPHNPVLPRTAASFNTLYFSAHGSDHALWTRVTGTLSSVPEFLPLDGKVVLRATAFHSDDVVFRTEQPRGAPPALPDRPASVNGTFVPTNPVPEPHYRHSSTDYQYFQNGTTAPHNYKAHKREAVVADLGGTAQRMSVPHWHYTPAVTASVRVSDIALQSGMLIEGITDGIADLPREKQLELIRARGVHGDPDVGAMEVRKLHEVTLVAELPVDVPNREDYVEIDPEFAIAPWECWPRLNHSPPCQAGEWPGPEPWQVCPERPSGTAWVP